MWLVLVKIFCALCAYLLWLVVKAWFIMRGVNVKSLRKFPFFIEIIIVTVVFIFKSPRNRFKLAFKESSKHNELRKFCIGPLKCVLVGKPECIYKVLMSHKTIDKAKLIYKAIDRPASLIQASTKNSWLQHRKFFNVSFNFKHLESYFPAFFDGGIKLSEDLDNQVGKPEFNFRLYSKRIILDVVSETFFGAKLSGERSNEIIKAFET
jgi:cytochrome P450